MINLISIDIKYRKVPLEKCSDKFYENSSNQRVYNTNYLCPKVDELELSGNRYSNSSTFFSLQLKRWDYTVVSWNEEIISQYFNGAVIELVIKNQYFDYTNLDNPVQTFFASSHSSRISLTTEKRVQFYVRKSQYELKEGWHSLGQSKIGEFYSIDRKEVDSTQTSTYLMYWADFVLDPLINEYERKSLTLFEAFGTIGGIFEILNIIIAIFTGIYAQYSFRYSLLKSLKKLKEEPLRSKESHEEQSIQRDRSQLYIPVPFNSSCNQSFNAENPFITKINAQASDINLAKQTGKERPEAPTKNEERDEEEKEGGESI